MLQYVAVACTLTELYWAEGGQKVCENTEEAESKGGGGEISGNE
jgi:hypothetical protein